MLQMGKLLMGYKIFSIVCCKILSVSEEAGDHMGGHVISYMISHMISQVINHVISWG